MIATAAGSPWRWLSAIALGAALLSVWMIQHGYAGLTHDSQLYTLLALARLEPNLLGNDIMVRFGSQDSFTLFGRMYAAAIDAFGAEHAAALLTLVSQAAFIAGAVLLARTIMPLPYAWLGVALVCALPGFYGARNVFAVIESFATPRLLAEALVLAGLAAFIEKRIWIAAALALGAAAIHPLMTAAGLATAVLMSSVPLHGYGESQGVEPRRYLWIVAAAAVTAGLFIAALVAQRQPVQFDDAWLRLLQEGTDYLFPSLWPMASWAREAVVLSTLFVGALVLERSPARSLCIATAVAAAIGTIISYVGGDLLRVVLIVQLQLWRWNWIATFAAALLLPLIAMRMWSQGALWRAVVFLLGASWLFVTFPKVALAIAVLVIPLALLASRQTAGVSAGAERALFLTAGIVAGVAVLFQLAVTVLAAGGATDINAAPAVIKAARAFSRTGLLPSVAFLAVFAVVHRAATLPAKALVSAGCVILLASLLPNSFREWTASTYGEESFRAFESWRARIPVGAEVLWFDSPLSSWLLLQRPSYLSNQQEVSALFSQRAAAVMKARVDAIAPHLDSTTFVGWAAPRPAPEGAASPLDLTGLCAHSDVKYVVTRSDVARAAVAAKAPNAPLPLRDARLYTCP